MAETAADSTASAPESQATSTTSTSSATSSSSGTRSVGVSRSLRRLSYDAASAALSPRSSQAQSIAQSSLSGGGSPLDAGISAAVTQTTGVDISHGRKHTGPDIDAACQTLGVNGFTLGGDVGLRSGASAHTEAHEYAHVAQQTGVPSPSAQGHGGGPSMSPSGNLEAEADAVATAALSGQQAAVSVGAAPQVAFDADDDREHTTLQEQMLETHGAEYRQIVRFLRGHTSDEDVRRVLETMSAWPIETIRRSWILINEVGGGNWFGDFTGNVGISHFREFPRECMATFQAMSVQGRVDKILGLISTGIFNGVSEEEAWYAFLVMRDLPADRVREIRNHNGGSNWQEYINALPREASQLLREALNTDDEATRRQEESDRQSLHHQSQLSMEGDGAIQGEMRQIRRWLDDSGLFQSVDENEARNCIQTLEGIRQRNPGALRQIVQTLENNRSLDRLVNALSPGDKYGTHVVTFLAILQLRPPVMALMHIEHLLSTGLFDWSVSAEEARLAYYLIRSQPVDVQRRFRERDNGAWLERMETNLGDEVTMARGGAEGDTVLAGGYGTVGSEEEQEQQREADRALMDSQDDWAMFEQIVADMRQGNDAQKRSCYARLAGRNDQIRQAMTRRLDAMGFIEELFDACGFDYIWADGRRHVTLSILAVRDPMRNIRHIERLLDTSFFYDWAVTSDEAYLALQLIRALPPSYQAQMTARNPEWFDTAMEEIDGGMRDSDDLNPFMGGEGQAGRMSILERLSCEETWTSTEPGYRNQLRNLIMQATAAGHRRLANQMAIQYGGFEHHGDLLTELRLVQNMDDYQADGVEGMHWYDYLGEGPMQSVGGFFESVGRYTVQGIDLLTQTEGLSLVDAVGADRLELDEVQDVLGGDIGGMVFSRTDGAEDEANTISALIDPSQGALHAETTGQLRIDSFRYPMPTMAIQTGPGTIDGFVVDATYPTEQAPEQQTHFALSIQHLVLNDVMIIMRDSMYSVTRVEVTGLSAELHELPISRDALQAEGHAQALLANIQPAQSLLGQVLAALDTAGDLTDSLMGAGIGGMGGVHFECENISLTGITTSGGEQIDSVVMNDLSVHLDRLPSQRVESQRQQIEREIDRTRRRIADLEGQSERSDLDNHELERLQTQISDLQARSAEIQAELSTLVPLEEEFLGLYMRQRNGDDLGDDLARFNELREQFQPTLTADVRQVTVAGLGLGGARSGEVTVSNMSVTGTGNFVPGDFIHAATDAATASTGGVQGTSDTSSMSGQVDIRMGRVEASDLEIGGAVPEYMEMHGRRAFLQQKQSRGEELTPHEAQRLETLNEQWDVQLEGGRTFGSVVAELVRLEDSINNLTDMLDAEGREDNGSSDVQLLARRRELRNLLRGAPITVGNVDARGVTASLTGSQITQGDGSSAMSGTGGFRASELSVTDIGMGATHIDSVEGYGVGGNVTGVMNSMANGETSSMELAGGGLSADELHVRGITNTDSDLDIRAVDATDLNISASTVERGGSLDASVGSLHISRVVQGNPELLRVITRINELETMEAGGETLSETQREELTSLRAQRDQMVEEGATTTGVQEMNLEGSAEASISGLGNFLQEGYSYLDRPLHITVNLPGSLTVSGVHYASNRATIACANGTVSDFNVDVTIVLTENAEGETTLTTGSHLTNFHLGSLEATGLRMMFPVEGEQIEVTVPTATLRGIDASEINLDPEAFDPVTMTGALSIDHMNVQAQARVGDYFAAHGEITVNNLDVHTLESGNVSFNLGELSLTDVGIDRTSGTIPEGSVVESLRGIGGTVRSLQGLNGGGELNRTSGELSFHAGLGSLSVSNIFYSGGGRQLGIGSGSITDAHIAGVAYLDPEILAAKMRGDEVPEDATLLRNLRVSLFRIQRIEGDRIVYQGDGVDLNLPHGYIEDIRVTGFDLNTLAFDAHVGSAGITDMQLGVTQQLTDDSQRIINAHATASVTGIEIHRGSDGHDTFEVGSASVSGSGSYQEGDTRVDVTGAHARTGRIEGSVDEDTGRFDLGIQSGSFGGTVETGGNTINAGGDFSSFYVERDEDGVISGDVQGGNLHVSGTIVGTGQVNLDLSNLGAGFTVTSTGFETTLSMDSLSLSSSIIESAANNFSLHLDGAATAHNVRATISGTFPTESRRADQSPLDSLCIQSLVIPRITVSDTHVFYEDVIVDIPSGTIAGVNISGLSMDMSGESLVVESGTVGVGSLNVPALRAQVGETVDLTGNISADTFDLNFVGDNQFQLSLVQLQALNMHGNVSALGLDLDRLTARTITYDSAEGELGVEQFEGSATMGAEGDSVQLSSGEGDTCVKEWHLDILSEFDGDVTVVLPINGTRIEVAAVVQDGRLQLGDSLEGLHLPFQEYWGWMPVWMFRRLVVIIAGHIFDLFEFKFMQIQGYVEGFLSADGSNEGGDPLNFDPAALSEGIVTEMEDFLGGSSALIDMVAPNGRGVIGTAQDELATWLTEWDPLDLYESDEAAQESADRMREEMRERRIQAVLDWIGEVGVSLNVNTEGEFSCDRGPFMQSGPIQNWIVGNARVVLTGEGTLNSRFRTNATANVSNFHLNEEGYAVELDHLNLGLSGSAGMDSGGTLDAGGHLTLSGSGLTVRMRQ